MASTHREISLPNVLFEALGLAAGVAGKTLHYAIESAANHLCASTSSGSVHDTVDYQAMVELGTFDDWLIERVLHCASPCVNAPLLEHEWVVFVATIGARVKYFSVEKVNRGAGNRSTMEMHEGLTLADVMERSGTDGEPRTSPRRLVDEFVPSSPPALRAVMSHILEHMIRPFSVLEHNCHDFACEVCALVRLAGAAPSGPAPPTVPPPPASATETPPPQEGTGSAVLEPLATADAVQCEAELAVDPPAEEAVSATPLTASSPADDDQVQDDSSAAATANADDLPLPTNENANDEAPATVAAPAPTATADAADGSDGSWEMVSVADEASDDTRR